MCSSFWIRMWLPRSAGTQHGHVQPVGGRGAGGDDCWVQLWQVSHQPEIIWPAMPSPSLPCRGFELLGPARRVCGTNGTWSPQGIPFCGEEAFFPSVSRFQCLALYIDNPGSRYTWWTCTRSQVERSHDFQSYVDIIFGTLFYPQSLGNTKNSTCFLLCSYLAIDNPDYLVQI